MTATPAESFAARSAASYAGAAGVLGLFRILFAASTLLFDLDLLPRGLWTGGVPSTFINAPPGLPSLLVDTFGGSLPMPVVYGLNVIALVSLWLLLAGLRTRTSSYGFAGSLLVLCANDYAYIKIDHNLFSILVPMILAGRWGEHWSLDAMRRSNAGALHRSPISTGLPLLWLAILLGSAMFVAARAKASSGWLDPDTTAAWNHVVFNFYANERDTPLTRFAMTHPPPRVMREAMDWATVLLEAVFILAVPWARAVRFLCAIALLFHAGIFVTMNIYFQASLLTYLAFVDWRPVRDALRHRRASHSLRAMARRVRLWHVAVAAAAWTFLTLWNGRAPHVSLLRLAGVDARLLLEATGQAIATAAALFALARLAIAVARRRRR